MESRQSIALSKKDKNIVLPSSELRIEKNGIDRISTPTKNTGRIYEDFCFDELLRMYPQDFVIGPRLIDYMGDVCHLSLFNSKGRTRPDSLILSTYLSMTFLTAIEESKSGNEPDLKSKANGFQDLLSAVENDHEAIYRGLKLSLGEQVDELPIYPQKICSLDDKLWVIFMTRYEVDELDESSYSRLNFVYEKRFIDLSKAA